MSGAARRAAGSSRLRTGGRLLLGAMLLFTGTAHVSFAREEFGAQVPAWVPLCEDVVVLASGAVELVLGAALILLPRQRVPLGWLTAGFLVAIFPGNLAQYLTGTDAFGLETDRARLARLFVQPVLVAWALWCTGAWAQLQTQLQAQLRSRRHWRV